MCGTVRESLGTVDSNCDIRDPEKHLLLLNKFWNTTYIKIPSSLESPHNDPMLLFTDSPPLAGRCIPD
jgi:hypothetical protein